MRQRSKLRPQSTAGYLQNSSIAQPLANITLRKRTPPRFQRQTGRRSGDGAVSSCDDIHASDTTTLSAHFDDMMQILLDEIEVANAYQEHSLVENYILAAMLLKGVQPTCHCVGKD